MKFKKIAAIVISSMRDKSSRRSAVSVAIRASNQYRPRVPKDIDAERHPEEQIYEKSNK